MNHFIAIIGVRSDRDDIPMTFSCIPDTTKTMAEFSGHNMYKDLIALHYKVIGAKVLTERHYITLAEAGLLHTLFVY